MPAAALGRLRLLVREATGLDAGFDHFPLSGSAPNVRTSTEEEKEMSAIRTALTPAEWRRAGALAAVVAGLHAVGFATLLAVAGPRGAALTVGVGLTAYTLGLRHAFDADHIAAIDNTTRKLTGEGKRPLSVGFFFSLGHSTVVFVLALLLAAGVRALAGQVAHGGSVLHSTTGLIGTLVSGCFLSLIGLLNLASLTGVVRAIRTRAAGEDALARPDRAAHEPR